MHPHRWIEFKGKRKIAVFAVAAVSAIFFACMLPAEAWRMRSGRASFFPPVPILMTVLWVGGWFAALFLKAQDLNLLSAFDYQRAYRWASIAAVGGGFALGALLFNRYLAA